MSARERKVTPETTKEEDAAAKRAATEEATRVSTATEVLGKLFSDGEIKLPESGRVEIKKVSYRTMKPILELVYRIVDDMKLTKDNLPAVNIENPALILKLISTYYDDVMEILVSLTNLTLDQLLDMDADESMLVTQSVIMRNKAFFMTKVLPNLQLVGLVIGKES